MCTGVELAIAGGAVASGLSSVMGGNASKSAYNAQADQVTLEARQKAAAIRRLARQTVGAARAQYAANGVDVNSGSPTIVQKDITYNSELDALNAIASGNATAKSLRKSGSAAQSASILGAAGTGLSAYGAILAA